MTSNKPETNMVEFEEAAASTSIARPPKKRNFESFQAVHLDHHPPTTYTETMMHLLKGNIGTGTYAMADAMRNSGLLLGPVLTLVIGVICVHAQHMLIKSADFLKEKNSLILPPTYAETVELSFLNSKSDRWKKWGPPMKTVCNVFICFTQFGFCSVYLLFVGKNLKDVLGYHGIEFDIHIWVTIGLIPVWLTAMIRTLKFIGKS